MARILLCGLGHVGFRVLTLLHELGEEVSVVTLGARSEWRRAAEAGGARILVGDARDLALLLEAGLLEASALIAATDSDVVNVEVAIDARQRRADLPVVVRLFDQLLAAELERTLDLRRAPAMSRIAAPSFVAAALGEEVAAGFSWHGTEFVVARLGPGRAGGLPALGAGGTVVAPRARWEAAAGIRREIPPRPSRLTSAIRLPHAIWSHASAAPRLILTALALLFVLSVFVFRAGLKLSLVDALYFLVSTLTTTGYGDISLKDSGALLKLYGCLVMLLGSAAIATLYSMLTDFVLTARLDEVLGRQKVPDGGHVIVVGLGNLGYRVVEELESRSVPAVVVETEREAPLAVAARAHAALVTGDGRLAGTLARAGVARARAVVAVTGDDAVNLSIGCAASGLMPGGRRVVRLFDAAFARKVETGLGVDAALSASLMAAPTFAAAALWPGVVAACLLEGRLWAVLERETPPSEAGRRPSDLGLPVVARDGRALDEPLTAGERILVAASRGRS